MSGLRKIDDFTLEITMNDRVEPGYFLFNMTTSILPKEEADKPDYAVNPVGLGPFKFKEHIPVTRLVKGKAYRAVSWLPLTSPGFDTAMQPYAFDPEKAKKLLAEAGYPNGFEFEWTTSQNESWGLPIVEAVIPMLARVGIRVKTKLVEVTVLTDVVAKGEFQAYIGSSQTGPDPLGTLRCFHSGTPRTACNANMFNDPAYDKVVDAAGQEADPVKQLALIKQANATELTHQYPEDLWVDATSPVAK